MADRDAEKMGIKMSDEDVLTLIKPDIGKAQQVQDDLAGQREDFYNAFRCELYGNERTGWAQSVAPVIWNNHQGNVSSLTEIFSDGFFSLKSDNEDRANKFQKLIGYQMLRKQDGTRRLYDFFYNACLYHYSVMKITYKEDYDIKTETYDLLSPQEIMAIAEQPDTQITKYREVEEEGGGVFYEGVKVARKDVKYAGPSMEVVPNWEFFYSPDCRITDWGGIDGRLVYHEVKLTLNDIRKRERAGIYRKGTYAKCLELGSTATAGSEETTIKYSADDLSSSAIDDQAADILGKVLLAKECCCHLDIDGDGLLEPCLVTLIEDEVIASVSENAYGRPPYRIGSLLPEPHKVHGISPADILQNDQKIMTNFLRFIQDMAAMSTYRNPVTNDPRMQETLRNRKPFDVILGDPAKLGEVPQQPPDKFVLEAWELMKGENEEKTGQSRYNQGLDAESLNKTATGISMISQASARRLRMSAKLLGSGAVTGIIRDFIFINQKWRTQDPIRLLGTDIMVNPEDLDGEYDIEIDIGVSPAEKQASANQVDLLIQFGTQAGIPMGLMTPLHLLKAQKKKYGLLNINVDDCMKSEQQFTADMQQQAQQPPKEDWKEFVQMDKLYPLLARSEQMQILSRLGIQPDPNAQIAGMPQAKDMMANQGKMQDAQIKAAQAQQDMAFSREKHALDMEKAATDFKLNVIKGAMGPNAGSDRK